MHSYIILELINNAALLLALSIVYEISYIIPVKGKISIQIINGVLIGVIGLAVMTIPFELTSGIVFDTRSILIGVSAITFGVIPTLLAALMTGLYRIVIGGSGIYAGVAVIASSAAIGLLWRNYLLRIKGNLRWLTIYGFGITIHGIMLLCMMLLPGPLSLQVLKEISLSVILIYPVATVLLSLLLLHQKERNEEIAERKRLENEKREIEAQLREQQKMEAIGTLAGGVAHEINNPINGIMNYAQLILDSVDPESRNAEYAAEIIHESERVSTIVRNLLMFSRHEKQSHSYAKIEDIINQTLSLIKTIIRKDQIQLDIHIEEDLPSIKCRSQQIQQVLMNLLTNAKDALNEKYPDYHEDKIIRIDCNQYFSEDHCWLRITVEDHGNGIPQELQDKIFEPFFSTKPKDKGTGLGLAISYGIIKDHQGKFMMETKTGSYTKMYLDLPVNNGWRREVCEHE